MIRKILSNLPKHHDFVRMQTKYATPVRLNLVENPAGNFMLMEKYNNDQIAYKFRYNLNGDPHGFQECFYPDGTVESYETWGWGIPQGDYAKYNTNGRLIEMGCFLKGEKITKFRRHKILCE